MRHGQAEAFAADDASRRLTDKGVWQAEQSAMRLQAHGIVPDRIISSPYIRARQTAKACATAWDVTAIEENGAFTPDDDPQQALDKLSVDTGTVLLVSHMPLVSYLTGLLLDANPYAGLRFGTASAAILDMDYPAAGLGVLSWFIDVESG